MIIYFIIVHEVQKSQHDRTIYVVIDKAKTALEEIKQPGRHFQDSKGRVEQNPGGYFRYQDKQVGSYEGS